MARQISLDSVLRSAWVTSDGMLTRPAQIFLREVLLRSGGTTAPDVDEVEALIVRLVGDLTMGEMAQQQAQPEIVWPDIQPPVMDPGLPELVFQQRPQEQASVPAVVVAGVSPFTHTAIGRQALVVTGGTVSLIEYLRGATVTACGVVAGMFEMSTGDRLRITYTVAPTITLIPR